MYGLLVGWSCNKEINDRNGMKGDSMEIKHEIRDGAIFLFIPAKKHGKFRFNKRETDFEFGHSFPTRSENFDDRVYLEWQIGYDVTVSDVKNGKKTTELANMHFVGSNGKTKYPYELSEILFKSIEVGLLHDKDIEELLKEIAGYTNFIDEKPITTEPASDIYINGLSFKETRIKLPTFYMADTMDDTQIEVSIEKQQYASGIQPMVYFCIPFHAFKNSSELRGRPSVSGDKLIYVIDQSNVINIVLMMKVFAMASKRHRHDIIEILKLLIEMERQ